MDFRNAQYADAEGIRIDCEIEHPTYGWIPFTADPNDSEERGRDIHAAIVAAGDIAAYVPPVPVPPTDDELDEMAAHAAREDIIRMTALTIALDDTRPEEERQRVVMVFPRWKVDEEVIVGEKRRHDGTLYECIQGHTTQADWEPQDTPALWNSLWEGAPGEVEPWTQPTGAHDAYQIGAKVTHNGKTWTNTVADNVWEPGVHGWVEDA